MLIRLLLNSFLLMVSWVAMAAQGSPQQNGVIKSWSNDKVKVEFVTKKVIEISAKILKNYKIFEGQKIRIHFDGDKVVSVSR
jgi:hypothetical protein